MTIQERLQQREAALKQVRQNINTHMNALDQLNQQALELTGRIAELRELQEEQRGADETNN